MRSLQYFSSFFDASSPGLAASLGWEPSLACAPSFACPSAAGGVFAAAASGAEAAGVDAEPESERRLSFVYTFAGVFTSFRRASSFFATAPRLWPDAKPDVSDTATATRRMRVIDMAA